MYLNGKGCGQGEKATPNKVESHNQAMVLLPSILSSKQRLEVPLSWFSKIKT